MKREEEYQRRFLLDELNALTSYGARRLTFSRELPEPESVKKARRLLEAHNAKARKYSAAQDRIIETAKAEIRQAIAFRKYNEALKLIEALKRRAARK